MSVTIPSLDPVTDILDTDKIMVTQSSGQTYTIDGASFNKRNQAVIANSTTLTGAPLKTGNIVRVHFTADITGVNTTTALSLSYNGTSKTVKVPKNGALVNFTAQNMGGSPTVYKYLQAYTTLELLYNGTNFVIIGNPVVISSEEYTIYADGSKTYTTNYLEPTQILLSNNTSSSKIFLLGKLQTNTDGRAGCCFDITYRRVDTVGRVLGVFRADNLNNQYLCLTPNYIPITMDLYVITNNREYNIYCEVAGYTAEIKITLSSLLNFVKNVQEVSSKTGTRIPYTALKLDSIAKNN